MRIGTWNVEYAYTRRLDAIRKVIESHPADVWVVTETHDDLVPNDLPHVAHSLPRPRDWNGIRPGSRWVSIWSRYPIVERVELPGADLERTAVAKLDTGSARPLLVYGTVLPWKGDDQIFNWDKHHRVIEQQAAEWLALTETYPDADLVIAGDYNTDMGTGRRYGTKKGISQLNAALDRCGLYCATLPDLLPRGLLEHPPIDHISLPRRWQEDARIVAGWDADRKRHSDHSGLVLETAE